MMHRPSQDQLGRERLLYRYSLALEQSDFATVARLLEIAAGDQEFEQMILDLNAAYCAEMRPKPVEPRRSANGYHPLEQTMIQSHSVSYSWHRISLATAAAFISLMILLLVVSRSKLPQSPGAGTGSPQHNPVFTGSPEVFTVGNLTLLPSTGPTDDDRIVQPGQTVKQRVDGLRGVASVTFFLGSPGHGASTNGLVRNPTTIADCDWNVPNLPGMEFYLYAYVSAADGRDMSTSVIRVTIAGGATPSPTGALIPLVQPGRND
jgi:hypothetical protein